MAPQRSSDIKFPGGKEFCLRDQDLRGIGIDPDAIDNDVFESIKRELQTILVGKFQKFVKRATNNVLGDRYR